MFEVKKTLEIAVSHKLTLPYDSPCERDHGHNLIITVYCRSGHLNDSGMVVDFAVIKKAVHGQLDHQCLNDIEGIGFVLDREFIATVDEMPKKILLNPTAERLAEWICMLIPTCYRVDVQESTGNVATYIDDGVRSV